MFLIDIDGIKILYTGDYSREEDRHLKPAEFPDFEVDVLHLLIRLALHIVSGFQRLVVAHLFEFPR